MEPGLGNGAAVELITANEAEMAYKLHVGGLMACAQQVLTALLGSIDLLNGLWLQVMPSVHVASVLIDGPLDAPGMRNCSYGAKLHARNKEVPKSKLLNPAV